MATLGLVRVDDRLIHGQVITKWLSRTGCNRIVIIDDDLANDEFLRNIYAMAAPPGVTVEAKSVDETLKEWNENELGQGKVLVLLRSIDTTKEIIDKGLPVKTLQIGGIGSGPGKKVVYQTVSLTQEEARKLKEIGDKGIEVYFQTIPEERKATLDNILKKHFKGEVD